MPANGDGSTLSLDFTTGVLDPRLSFTRTTNATFINSQGYVQYADANLVLNSTMLVSTAWTAATSGGGTVTINNDNTVTFASTAGRATWLQSITIQSGLPVTFSIEVTALTNTNIRVSDLFGAVTGFTSQVYNYTDLSGNTTANIGAFTTLPGVGLYTVNATTTATSGNVIFGTDCNGVTRTGSVTIARPQLQYGTRVSSRVYLANSSTSAANTNTPRFDYDPTTLTPRGLLIEGSASTLNQYSEDFSNAYWSKPNASVSSTSVAGPDNVAGTTRRIVEDNTTNQHGIRRSFSMTSGATYTMSVFVKPGSYDSFGFEMYASASNNAKAEVTSIIGNTQTVTSASGVNATIVRTPMAASGWYRYALTFTSTATQSGDFNILIRQTNSYAGNGTNYMDVYGFMLETGFGASSYIPTGASTGFRAFDSCVMDNITSLQYSTTNGSMYYEGRFSQLNTLSFPWRMGVTTESGDHRVFGFLTNSGGSSVEAKGPSSTPTASVGVSLALNTDYKLAWSMDTALATGEIRRSSNGGEVSVSSATALTVTGTPTYFMFGQKGYGAFFPAGTIKAAKYWPTTLPDAQLQTITT
jgi:hypothetical protein